MTKPALAHKHLIHDSYTDAMQLPDLVRLGPNLVIAAFRLMKLLPAKHVVEKALRDGRIDRNALILETTSGTYGLGLAMVCAENGIRFELFSDAAIDPFLERRIVELGGKVHKVTKTDASAANLQVMRLKALQERLENDPHAFWPRQYDNTENQEAYHLFADQMAAVMPRRFTLVATVGSGSSSCGTIKRLRQQGFDVDLVGIDTFGSVLFGLPNGKRVLRGLGNSVRPKNLEHDCFDEIHWVHEKDAFLSTRQLHARTSIFFGPTSGASYRVASWIAEHNPEREVVFIGCDEGHRYRETVYNDEYLDEHGFLGQPLTAAPAIVESLSEITPPWCRFDWGRKTYREVTGEDY